jgi:hypothetical protein
MYVMLLLLLLLAPKNECLFVVGSMRMGCYLIPKYQKHMVQLLYICCCCSVFLFLNEIIIQTKR